MDNAYLERTTQDLHDRVSTIILNGEQTVLVKSVQKNGNRVMITTECLRGISKITSLKLLDENGGLITERKTNLDIYDEQSLEFVFLFEVKEGAESVV